MTKKDYGSVTFRDNSKIRDVGIGSVGFAGITQVEQVLLVDGLKHNLLSISQLCDEGSVVVFEKDQYVIKIRDSDEVRFIAQRNKNIYILQLKELADQDVYLIANKLDQLYLCTEDLAM